MTIDITTLAARLGAAATQRAAIDQITADIPGLDLPTAYRVQRELRKTAGPLAGWKLGLTSHAKQTQVGVSEPIHGFLTTAGALNPGEPLDTSQLIQPRCEPEIAFLLGQNLAGTHITNADVLTATASVTAAIEVLDSRYHDYRFTTPDVVADNASAARYLIGAPVPPQGIDLRLVAVVLQHNGQIVATASGAAALGHPAAAVAWLARTLATDADGLQAGDIVLSGGLTAAVPVRPGDAVVVSIDQLGSLELDCI